MNTLLYTANSYFLDQMAEYRLSIYGRSPKEWDKIAAWVCDNRLFSVGRSVVVPNLNSTLVLPIRTTSTS